MACPGGLGWQVCLTLHGFFSAHLLSLPARVRGWLPATLPADSEPRLPPGPRPAAQAPWGAGGRLGPRPGGHPEPAPLPGEARESSGWKGEGGHVGGAGGPPELEQRSSGGGVLARVPPGCRSRRLVRLSVRSSSREGAVMITAPLVGLWEGSDQRRCPVTWKVEDGARAGGSSAGDGRGCWGAP